MHKSRMQVINQSETVLHAVADGVLVSLSESTITSCAVAVANVQSQINIQMGQVANAAGGSVSSGPGLHVSQY